MVDCVEEGLAGVVDGAGGVEWGRVVGGDGQ